PRDHSLSYSRMHTMVFLHPLFFYLRKQAKRLPPLLCRLGNTSSQHCVQMGHRLHCSGHSFPRGGSTRMRGTWTQVEALVPVRPLPELTTDSARMSSTSSKATV